MKGMWHTEETDGFYWAGDQGLFIGCMMNEKHFKRLINFNWHPGARLPQSTSGWDDTNRAQPDPLRAMVLQAAGLNAFVAAAVLDPNGTFGMDETENKPEPALT